MHKKAAGVPRNAALGAAAETPFDLPADACATDEDDAETPDFAGLDLAEDDAAPSSVRAGAAVIRGFCATRRRGPASIA